MNGKGSRLLYPFARSKKGLHTGVGPNGNRTANDPAPAKRKEAILAIAALGVQGRAAEPMLVELLRDPDREVRLLAGYALKKLESGK